MKKLFTFNLDILVLLIVSLGNVYSQANLASSVPSTTFEQSYSTMFGRPETEGDTVELKLDRNSGSGFKSIHSYFYGFFSASIKLPANYSAGVVTAFYASNYEEYTENHDEIDFEFLGVVPGSPYVLQTNVYGSGSVEIGREERMHLWFDPTADFHRYSFLWNEYQLVFFVDDMPVRQMRRSEELGNQYPSKPVHLYSTIWDGSNWATNGGDSPVNYEYSPFVSTFTDFKLQGCEDGVNCDLKYEISRFKELNEKQKSDLAWVRTNHLSYSYCDDRRRYPTPLPECLGNSNMQTTKGRHRHTYRKIKFHTKLN